MARPLRITYPGAFYHVTSRGNERKDIFKSKRVNPVRAKMVKTPEEYEWSSYQFYIGEKKPPEWLYRDFILGYFGKKVSIAQKEYHKFVTALINKKYDNPLDEVVSSTLLGSPDFIAFIKDKIRKDKKLERKISKIEKKINASRMKT